MISWGLFIISAILNVFAAWYIRELLSQFKYLDDQFLGLSQTLKNYKNHLGAVCELDVFYGDETLGGLMQHTKDIDSEIDEFKQIFPFEDNILEEVEDADEQE
jgi:hypothetical protein